VKDVRLAVVVPVGPRDDWQDTLESVRAYTDPSRLVVLVDDGAGVRCDAQDVDVVPAPAGMPGNRGGLFGKLSYGYRHALERASFRLLLRLDADALLLGPGLEELAEARFAADPRLGLLGSYRIGPDGAKRDFTPAARLLLREPAVRGLLDEASANGYELGEHALGGAYLHRREAVDELARRGWLDLPKLYASEASEDHLMGLLTVAAGYRLGDFGGPGDPLALRWQGLPMAPEELLARGKLVTHSVRRWQDRGEEEIRAVFRAARARPAARKPPAASGSQLGGSGSSVTPSHGSGPA
jgi:hypothetical protein